jgi:hypothetical protein
MTEQLGPPRLPQGLRSTGDPVDGNPFVNDDPRYRIWEKATREAETENSLVISDYLEYPPRTTPSSRKAFLLDLSAKKFDLWAKRGLQVVWNTSALGDYDEWLFKFAESWLEKVATHRPAEVDFEVFLIELQTILIVRREHWKIQARRYLAAFQTHSRNLKLEKSRKGKDKAPSFFVAVNLLRKNRDLTLVAFCRWMDSKSEQFRGVPKYKPPTNWKVQSFYEQYRKRPNTVSRFLSTVRKYLHESPPQR